MVKHHFHRGPPFATGAGCNSPLKVIRPLGYTFLSQGDLRTGGKREKPEDIVLKMRQVEVLQGQGKPLAHTVRQTGVTVQT